MLKLVALLVVVLGAVSAAPRHDDEFIRIEIPNTSSINETYPMPDGRIVGGSTTTIALHPWQISLQFGTSHFCGGILISNTFVLTAAHCLTSGYSTNLFIRAGSASRSGGGQQIRVSAALIHSGWRPNQSMDNDIAILQLASAVTVATARAAVLPSQGVVIPTGATITTTGWGATSEGGTSPDALQAVNIPSVTRANCRAVYGTASITTNMFCAGTAAGGRDSCQGDSGGPASTNNVVVGIVSWGSGCARPNIPGVYVKISQYRTWITNACGV